jgi:hypothetical protein
MNSARPIAAWFASCRNWPEGGVEPLLVHHLVPGRGERIPAGVDEAGDHHAHAARLGYTVATRTVRVDGELLRGRHRRMPAVGPTREDQKTNGCHRRLDEKTGSFRCRTVTGAAIGSS